MSRTNSTAAVLRDKAPCGVSVGASVDDNHGHDLVVGDVILDGLTGGNVVLDGLKGLVYDPEEHYPEIYLGRGLSVQLLWLIKPLGAKFLLKVGAEQRNSKNIHLNKLGRDLLAGFWRLNGETIVFNNRGELIDGIHRCKAVVATGVPMLTLVVRGVSPAVYSTIDGGSGRSPRDTLAAMGVECSSVVSAAAGLLYRYEQKMLRGQKNSSSNISLSSMEVSNIVQEHPGLRESGKIGIKFRKTVGYDSKIAFSHYILNARDEADAADFFGRFLTGEDLKRGEPILGLRNAILEDRETVEKDHVPQLIFKAWNLQRRGKAVPRKLAWVPSEGFPNPI